MKWILILVLSSTGGWSINRWEQPAMTTAEFDDRASCEKAIAAAAAVFSKDRRLDNVQVRGVCVAQGELAIK